MKNTNKETFVMPSAEVVLFNSEDVITTSTSMFGFFGDDDEF